MAHTKRKTRKNAKAYRLSFSSTRAKKWAPTMKQAVDDAQYWLNFGVSQVCIDRKTPTGSYKRLRCMHRR